MRKYAAIQVMSQAATSAAGFFIPVLVHELGGNALDVGLIAAGFGLAQFVSSFHFGRVADVGKGGRRRLLKWGLGLSALAVLLQAFATNPLLLGGARVTFGFCAGMYPAALMSLAYDENRRLGKFSSWGSLGFGLGTLSGGLLGVSGFTGGASHLIFLLSATLLACCYVVALTIRYPPDHTVMVPTFPKEVIDRNLPAYTAMVFRHTGMMAAWSLLPLYLYTHFGASLLWLGAINATNAAFQFFMMPRADRFSSRTLILAGVGLTAAALAGLLLAPNLWWILALQPLFAASWAAMYMGSLKFVLERNVERATSTGLLQSTIHMSNVTGPLVGGLVAYLLSFHATVALGIVFILLAAPMFFYELKRHPSQVLPEEPPLAPEPVAPVQQAR